MTHLELPIVQTTSSKHVCLLFRLKERLTKGRQRASSSVSATSYNFIVYASILTSRIRLPKSSSCYSTYSPGGSSGSFAYATTHNCTQSPGSSCAATVLLAPTFSIPYVARRCRTHCRGSRHSSSYASQSRRMTMNTQFSGGQNRF